LSVAPRRPPDDENLQRPSGARLALVVVAAVPIEEILLRENGNITMCAGGWLRSAQRHLTRRHWTFSR